MKRHWIFLVVAIDLAVLAWLAFWFLAFGASGS